ncbi:alcohol dehydrogenase catalytic domain-containing protein [Methylobacterium platani]|uniref:Alcohol dehydrogenase-like N-terminal domain-containing protein n=2 Tax=Methylobacterium platani TaxID=427683 RepID=A0A179RY79_9HYPH|nr:alcohol dehydrogenase catalytic domain-containing protein [Methylobacterium platani]KMO13634.1 hypothetical protein SQ03_21330 [Methylobacterium platani JCM 14648]OAS15879.1 hypothetical protein A5481_29280 [Methylobacterium platani]
MMRFPKVSRAAVVRSFKAPVCIEEVPVPQELEPGTILTKIETCSICGTDVHLWQGSLALKVDLPVILGHEMVGRIVATGSGTDRDSVGQPLRVGDRITWTHTACGIEHLRRTDAANRHDAAVRMSGFGIGEPGHRERFEGGE